MWQVTEAYLEQVVQSCRSYAKKGKVADYIPELGKMNPDLLGVSISDCDGNQISAGDHGTRFTLQSMSKVISLLVALQDVGEQTVFEKVDVEPSADNFNSIRRLEIRNDHKPVNPMINAGAIAVASLIQGRSVQERFDKILAFLKAITGNEDLWLNEEVYRSEKRTGDRNRSLAYFMKSTGIIETDVEDALDLYFRFCSIQITCCDLAKIGCFLAHGACGSPKTTLPIPSSHVRMTLAIMMTSGMYNASGEFAIRVGIPAKSGVSGGILAVVPGKMGIGVIGPAIDDKGNSLAGLEVLKRLSDDLTLSLFS